MCGGYELTADPEALVEAFKVQPEQLDLQLFGASPAGSPTAPQSAHVAELFPGMSAPIVVARTASDGSLTRHLGLARWGLIPFWAKDPNIGRKLFNARSDGLSDKPSFRGAFRERRCLIPVSAFYEWRRDEQGKSQRFRFRPRHGAFLALAGLWETWRDAAGNKVGSFTVVTTDANDVVSPIHERMPVILAEGGHDLWLSRASAADELLKLLVPCPRDWVTMEPG
jgi:putative SOS response-associated peptidase YedK